MEIIADLHIHSRFSRATSHELTIENLEKYARIKGLSLLGTGDFTNPSWLKELKQDLTEDDGILKTKTGFPFILQAEVSNIYSQDNKLRKIHHILLAKSFDVVEQINEVFSKKGNLKADGRPIFGNYPSYEMVEALIKIDKDIEVVPAHCWTPWFSLFGSMSGFDRIEDCYKEQTKYIHALETGLSSDPAMNWRLSALDKYTLVSNSDSHSFWPWRIGRECNVFEIKTLTYRNLINAIRTKEGLVKTIEFWPHEGKYHFTGHRLCNVCLSPKEALKIKDICPKCGRTLTVGVAERVEFLADRPEGFVPKDAISFKNLIPLTELIAGVTKSAVGTKRVWQDYYKLIKSFRDEINILLNVEEPELKKVAGDKIAGIVIKNRNQKIPIRPGFDGVYGKPVFSEDELEDEKLITKSDYKQKSLSEFS